MSLGEMVLELEDDFERLKDECRNLEQSVDEIESELEDVTNQLNKANEFREWVQLAYPVVVKDYESVKLIEEIANEHS
jgi:chromosome segregation ATPase